MRVKVINDFVAENIIEVEQYGYLYLDGWNGYRYDKCFDCTKSGYPATEGGCYLIVTPIYEPVDDESDQYELVEVEVS